MRSPRLAFLGLLALLVVAASRAHAGEIDDLVDQLGSETSSEAYQAYRSLTGRKEPAILERVVQRIEGWTPYSQQFGMYLVQAFPHRDAMAALRRLVKSSAPYVRAASAAELHRRGERRMEDIIVDVLLREDLDDGLRAMIVGRIYGLRLPGVQAAVREMLGADASLTLLLAAFQYLLAVRDEAAVPVAERLLEEDAATLRAMAAVFLYRMGHEGRAEELAAAIRSGEIEYQALWRVETLLKVAPHVSGVILDAFVARLPEEETASKLLIGIRLLEKFRWTKGLAALRELLAHENSAVAQAALKALAAFPGAIGVEQLTALLDHEEEERRLMAADALRRIDDLTGLDAVIGILARGTTKRSDAARLLGEFRVPEAVEPLLSAALDPDVSVRSNAWSSVMRLLPALFPYRRFDFNGTGYAVNGSASARESAVTAVRAWWETNRTRDW